MKQSILLLSVITCISLFASDYELSIDRLNRAYNLTDGNNEVKIPYHNVNKSIRNLSDEKLTAILSTGSHYLSVSQLSDNSYGLDLNGRLLGGRQTLGKILYVTIRAGAYVVIACGVMGVLFRNKTAQAQADVINKGLRNAAQNMPSLSDFKEGIQTPAVVGNIANEVITQVGGENAKNFVQGATDVAVGMYSGGMTSTVEKVITSNVGNRIVSMACGGTSNVISNNEIADTLAQQSVGYIGALGSRVGLKTAAENVSRWGKFASAIKNRAIELDGVIEWLARGAQVLGNMVPGPL